MLKNWQDKYINQVVQGDCLELLKELPDRCVDLIVTDPPYGGIVGGYDRTPCGGVGLRLEENRAIGQEWVAVDWYDEAARISRNGVVVFCGHKDVDELPGRFSSLRKVCLLTWEETNAAPTGKNVPRFTTQFAWVFGCGNGYDFGTIKKTCFHYPHQPGGCMKSDRPDHPCPKPPRLMRDIISQFDCELILDPFAGSGTTLVAAKQLGRKYIGIEISPKYVAICKERLKQEVMAL